MDWDTQPQTKVWTPALLSLDSHFHQGWNQDVRRGKFKTIRTTIFRFFMKHPWRKSRHGEASLVNSASTSRGLWRQIRRWNLLAFVFGPYQKHDRQSFLLRPVLLVKRCRLCRSHCPEVACIESQWLAGRIDTTRKSPRYGFFVREVRIVTNVKANHPRRQYGEPYLHFSIATTTSIGADDRSVLGLPIRLGVGAAD